MTDECAICAKHRGEGPLQGELVGRWDGFWVYHAAPDTSGLASLGHLFIESDRHAPCIADLTEHEAAQLGQLRTNLARAVREELGAEFVLAAVIGMGLAHFHEHVFARFRGTPRDVPWHQSDEAAPRVDGAAVHEFAERVRERVNLR